MTETLATTETLAALFNRVADRIEATHGPAKLRTDDLFTRCDEPFMSAAWFPDLVNNGFKLAARQSGTIRIVTWAHRGPFHSADVIVAPELAEELLLALLPPAIRPPARSPLAELADRIDAEADDLDPEGYTRNPDAAVPGNRGNPFWRAMCEALGLRRAAATAREDDNR